MAAKVNTALVEIVRNQAVTTSLKVAEIFGKEHAKVVKDINRIISDCAEMASEQESSKLRSLETAKMFRKSSYKVEGQLRSYPFYYMNFDGFTLLAMGFTGKKALLFKLKYIAAFNAMKKIIEQRQNAEWLSIRDEVKATFRKLTDAVRDFVIPLARRADLTLKEVFQTVISTLADYARIALIAVRFGVFQTAVVPRAYFSEQEGFSWTNL